MRGLFPARIACMRSEGVIEGFAIDILRVIRKMSPDGIGKVVIPSIGHVYFARV
jgi:hypothetical protein